MKLKTILVVFLLLITCNLESCASKGPGKTAGTEEEALKQIAKKDKKSAREAKKAKKEAFKHYWKNQSKDARKSIKRNKRKQRKISKHNKRKKSNEYLHGQ